MAGVKETFLPPCKITPLFLSGMKENWDELVRQKESSGMKPADYCRARGIDPTKLGDQRWRRKGAQKKEYLVGVGSGATAGAGPFEVRHSMYVASGGSAKLTIN